uniref:Uncharacterized protein n=1 Tax=Avena sativa TaxID=4498 RepID=A0ACD5ZS86_AVESA
MAGEVVQFWNEWGIQTLVLLSFTFQVFLLVVAGIRRRKASAVLMLLLWLVYLLADSTAIYALGHLSVITNTWPEHRLVAFWAPFLLLHLGGPDSITAYALEDSRLWLRHLLTLVVQALGAVYVVYSYVPRSSSTLQQQAAVLMLAVGVLKYAERTWALKCGGTADIRRRAEKWGTVYLNSIWSERVWSHVLDRGDDNEEELLIGAYLLFFLCIHLFAGTVINPGDFDMSRLSLPRGEDVYRLVEMEMSLMYDTMYTKARVIHTWYGYCIRAISLVATTVAALLFQFSSRRGYSRVDVAITYVLLVGAVAMEIVSVSKTMGSTWMCAWLYRLRRERLLGLLKYIRRSFRAARRRRWSGSIGQYNLLHLICIQEERSELGGRLASMVGLGGWWSTAHYTGTAHISATDLRELLLKTLPRIDARNSRGIHALESRGLDKYHAGWCHWSTNNIDFDQSILVWHIATDVYLHKSKARVHTGTTAKLAEAVKVLSNYMVFLLVTKPDMLPGLIRRRIYVEACKELYFAWLIFLADQSNPETVLPKKWWHMLKGLFHHDGPNGSRTILETGQLAGSLHSTYLSEYRGEWRYSPTGRECLGSCAYRRADDHARELAAELLGMESRRSGLLEVIFEVWVEMLCYAALHCSPDSHARQLSNGGELITVVWLLIHHLGKSE